MDWSPPACTPSRERIRNPGMCPNWESNPQTFGVLDDAPTEPLGEGSKELNFNRGPLSTTDRFISTCPTSFED